MFVCRNVANLVPPFDADGNWHGTSAALEFGITRLKVRHLVIMGHGRCGGIAASLDPSSLEGSDFIGRWISLLEPVRAMIADDPMETAARHRALEFASVRQSIVNLQTFPWIASEVASGALKLHGAWFDISTGELFALDGASGEFVSMAETGQQALGF